MPNTFVLNNAFKGKSENRMRHVTFETLSCKHRSRNFLHLVIACTTVLFVYCYVPDLIHPSDWGVRIIRQVTPSLSHLLTIKNGQGSTLPVSIWWFLTHHTAGGFCFGGYLFIYLKQRWCFILNLCVFDEKHALKLLLKCMFSVHEVNLKYF